MILNFLVNKFIKIYGYIPLVRYLMVILRRSSAEIDSRRLVSLYVIKGRTLSNSFSYTPGLIRVVDLKSLMHPSCNRTRQTYLVN